VPFTFLAHQAPVLAIAERRDPTTSRWHGVAWDGVALVAGSVMPDLFYVTEGWLFSPWGNRMWFNGHPISHLPVVTLCACVLALVVRVVVLPVVPFAGPDLGRFHLHDLATRTRRPPWWATLLSALVGAVTHLVLDAFTHSDGLAVRAVPLLAHSIGSVRGHNLVVYQVLQYGGSVVLGLIAVVQLRRLGERRALRGDGPATTLDPAGRWLVWLSLAFGVTWGLLYAWARHQSAAHSASVVAEKAMLAMAFCWPVLLSMCAGCLIARRFLTPARVPQSAGEA
jgi:hypothetical protein